MHRASALPALLGIAATIGLALNGAREGAAIMAFLTLIVTGMNVQGDQALDESDRE